MLDPHMNTMSLTLEYCRDILIYVLSKLSPANLMSVDYFVPPDSTFCSRVTQEEYQKQSEDGTKEALIEMMNSVLDDTQVPLKEKKQRLKCFQKIYPALYEKYFQGLI